MNATDARRWYRAEESEYPPFHRLFLARLNDAARDYAGHFEGIVPSPSSTGAGFIEASIRNLAAADRR